MLLNMLKRSSLLVLSLVVSLMAPVYTLAALGPVISVDAQYLDAFADKILKIGDTGMVFQSEPTVVIWDSDNRFSSAAAIASNAYNYSTIDASYYSNGGYSYLTNMTLSGNFSSDGGVPGSVASILFLTSVSTGSRTPFAFVTVNGATNAVGGFFIVTQNQAMIASLSLVQNKPISFTTRTGTVISSTGNYTVEDLAESVKFD